MYWEIYAYIVDGKIKDIAVFAPDGGYTKANMLAKQIYGNSAIAVNVTDYPVQIGDIYGNDGLFYRDKEVIEKTYTVDDDILSIKLALAELGSLIGGA